MNHLNVDGHETKTKSHEKIEVIGEPLPKLSDMYETLSTIPDVVVASEAAPHRKGAARRLVSEREMVDDLLEFCAEVKQLKVPEHERFDQQAIEGVDEFVDSIHLMSREAYREATEGHARRHALWLEDNENRRIRFTVQRNKTGSSQQRVSSDIAAAIVAANPELSGRVDVCLTEALADGLTSDTKVVLADDWAVSGNLLEQDVSNVYQARDRFGVTVNPEVNLLLAREDQISDGIHTLGRPDEYFDRYQQPEVVAYFSTPKVRSIYGKEAIPTGSHSSVDYGFSETLGGMYRAMERYGHDPNLHMPYAAVIVPDYADAYQHPNAEI